MCFSEKRVPAAFPTAHKRTGKSTSRRLNLLTRKASFLHLERPSPVFSKKQDTANRTARRRVFFVCFFLCFSRPAGASPALLFRPLHRRTLSFPENAAPPSSPFGFLRAKDHRRQVVLRSRRPRPPDDLFALLFLFLQFFFKIHSIHQPYGIFSLFCNLYHLFFYRVNLTVTRFHQFHTFLI